MADGMTVMLTRNDDGDSSDDWIKHMDDDSDTSDEDGEDEAVANLSTAFEGMPSPTRGPLPRRLPPPSEPVNKSNSFEGTSPPTPVPLPPPSAPANESAPLKKTPTFHQDLLESELHLLTKEKDWKGSIVLRCLPMTELDLDDVGKANEVPSEIDICDYLNGQKTRYCRLNFCTSDFPPPTDKAFYFKDEAWPALKSYIIRQSRAARSPVICPSSSSSGEGRLFVCYSLNDANSKNKQGKRVEEEYRKTILVNDGERGERINGRSGPRRTSTQDISDGTCGFKFTVRCDSLGYYITLFRCAGRCYHCGHVKYNFTDVGIPLQHLEKEDLKELKNVHDTQAGEGICKAYFFKKTGMLLDRGKFAYLFGDVSQDGDTFSSDIDNLLKDFKANKDTAYVVFWDLGSKEKDTCRLVSECHSPSSAEEESSPTVTDLTADPNMAEVVEMVREDRQERKIDSKQNVFVSIMWAEKGKCTLILRFIRPTLVSNFAHRYGTSLLTYSHQKCFDISKCIQKQFR